MGDTLIKSHPIAALTAVQPTPVDYANLCDLSALRAHEPVSPIGPLLADLVADPLSHIDRDVKQLDACAILLDVGQPHIRQSVPLL